MSEFPQLLEMIFQGIFNTFDMMEDIRILGTNLLQVSIAFLIANALVSLMIVVNHTKIRTGDSKK